MKRRLLLPMLAMVFAVAGAFASPLFVQKGWIDTNGPAIGGGGVELDIVTPPGDTPVCSTSANDHQCMVIFDEDFYPAFASEEGAETNDPLQLLRYDD